MSSRSSATRKERHRDAGSHDGFRFYHTVDSAFEDMLAAIDSAHQSIRFEVYIYRVSPIGEQFRDALIRACRRKLQVQVLVDALGSVSLPEKFWDPFVEAGGKFKWFNPLKLKRLGFRDHRKMLVIDEKVAFVGGFNVAPEYQGDGVAKGWHDTGIQVPEPLARELAAAFDVMFSLAEYRHRRLARYRRSDIARIASTPAGDLLTNAPGRGRHFLKGALVQDINRSQQVDVISAYFLPPRQLRRALMKAARAGRRTRLLLAGKSDVALSQLAARRLYTSLMAAGIEIYEYQPQILHTKLFLFDDVCYIGSANMDKRSLLVNYELLVRIEDTTLAQEARQFFDTAITHSRRLELAEWRRSRSLWSRLKEQWAFFVLARVDPYLTRVQLEVLYREIDARSDVPYTARTAITD